MRPPPLPLPLPVSASAARTIVLHATRPPRVRAAIRLILLNFMLPLLVCFCCSARPSFAAADGFYFLPDGPLAEWLHVNKDLYSWPFIHGFQCANCAHF